MIVFKAKIDLNNNKEVSKVLNMFLHAKPGTFKNEKIKELYQAYVRNTLSEANEKLKSGHADELLTMHKKGIISKQYFKDQKFTIWSEMVRLMKIDNNRDVKRFQKAMGIGRLNSRRRPIL